MWDVQSDCKRGWEKPIKFLEPAVYKKGLVFVWLFRYYFAHSYIYFTL